MKTIFKSMSCLILGAMIVTPMFAQQKDLYPELEGPGPVVIISKDKNGKEELINVFEETQRPHFHDPRAPRFLLTDQQGKFALGIGGYLKTTMEYDFNGIVDDVDFIPALIPQPGSTAVRNQFQMDASTSTIFLKLVGRTKHLGNFIVYTAETSVEVERLLNCRMLIYLSWVLPWGMIPDCLWILPQLLRLLIFKDLTG